jgi:hypothetical protein
MGAQLSDMSLWHNGTPSASAGATMVYSNNIQQATAFSRLHVVAGSRSCFRMETGYGGAALVGFLDIECGTSTNTNPGMVINMPATIFAMDNVIIESNPPVTQNGISITGGYVDLKRTHCENYSVCIDINQTSGIVSVRGSTGNIGGCGVLVKREAGSTANRNIIGQSYGCTTATLNNNGVTTVGPIIEDTKF